ncbi:A24 family peptidase [Caldibacillus lycopersici]|uniref:A24 family peptidase n=1 Tax=Perspicuibacillus lycopersici TaxID=1325689 RepID=A0AAE3ITY0_9BACI|nr:A24 family peptidase [Perspicuibacillus lycopersici]MCU9613533.1 A24 family peptidase [Perspicuibacillus lycopersici]
MTTIILLIALSISLCTDIKNRKILNIVTLPAMLLGLAAHTFTAGLEGFLFSFYGILTGFALLVIPYALKGMAAGDVKLLMAIGALKGSAFVIGSFLYIAIIGGIIALIILMVKKDLLATLKRMIFSAKIRTLSGLSTHELHHAFPYGVAIVLGTISFYGVGPIW